MAMDQFMKIAAIEGEARDHKHGKEIEVLAWSWGMSQSGSAHVGGGMGAGKVNVQDLSFTKWLDRSSPTLMLKCSTGAHIKDALLTVRKAGGEQLEYLKITMTDVMITSVSTGGSGGEDRLTENVSLNFAKVKVEYTEQDAKGGAGKTIPYEYDIAQNKSA